jgi:hypothetical protein
VADQRQTYAKGDGGKDIKQQSLAMTKGGSSNSGNSGPTGSARDYGKHGKSSSAPSAKNWNPMKSSASKYGIEGCGG